MSSRYRLLTLGIVLAFILALGWAGCVQTNDETTTTKVRRVAILVIQDDLFNFQPEDVIGKVEFHKYRGPVGSRVSAKCIIDRLSSFPDRQVNVVVQLRNPDAARVPFQEVSWVQDTNEKIFSFYIPVVESVPSILDFRVFLWSGEATSDDDDTAVDDDADDTAADDTTTDDTSDEDDEDDTLDDDTVSADFTAPFMAAASIEWVVNSGVPGMGD